MRLSKTLQHLVLSSVCALSALPVQAAITVIDFNSLATVTTNPTVVVPQPYTEDGFRLTTSSGSPYTGYAGGTIYALTPNHGQWMGTPAVYSGVITNYGSSFVLERADGGVFDLLSMESVCLTIIPISMYTATTLKVATSINTPLLFIPTPPFKPSPSGTASRA